MLHTVLVVFLVILWIVFIWSVLLMSPKWWLWAWILWWWAGWHEYGGKKSIERKLKYVAMVTWILFILISLFLPYFASN